MVTPKTPIQIAIKKKLDEITQLLLNAPDPTPSSGLYGGKAGIVLYFSYLGKLEKSTNYHAVINRFISDSFESINEKFSLPAYSLGISGILWTIHHLTSKKLIDADNELEEVVPYLGEHLLLQIQSNNFDFLHGALGIAFYLLQFQDEHCNFYLSEFIKQLQQKSISDMHTAKWEFTFNTGNRKTYNLSLSHGMASIIIFLSKCYEQKRYDAKQTGELLKKSLAYVLLQKNNAEKKTNSLFPNSGEMNTISRNSRLSWCYGDLGIASAFWQAGKALDENKWKEEAITILLHASHRRDLTTNQVLDAGICHGTAGIAHIFNRFYWETKNPAFKDAANYWIEETLHMARFSDGLAGYKAWYGENGWVNQYGILEGIAGIGLVLISYLAEEEPAWDSCLLLS